MDEYAVGAAANIGEGVVTVFDPATGYEATHGVFSAGVDIEGGDLGATGTIIVSAGTALIETPGDCECERKL